MQNINQGKTGKFIAEKRREKKLTQEQLAEKLNLSKNAVSKWERGLNLPDVSVMPQLCEILQISLNELFAGEEILEDEYKKQADRNLLAALENSAFSLQEKIKFYKTKYIREHVFEWVLETILVLLITGAGVYSQNGLAIFGIVLAFAVRTTAYNRMMAYIEKHAYSPVTNEKNSRK